MKFCTAVTPYVLQGTMKNAGPPFWVALPLPLTPKYPKSCSPSSKVINVKHFEKI